MKSTTPKKISIVVPFFNEEGNLARIYGELQNLFKRLPQYLWEVVFMDNHSTDRSFEIASEIAQSHSQTKVMRLSRNFGYQANILTGLLNATGDAVVQIDADGEDDPALIAEFIAKWEQGYKVVYGVRKLRQESWLLTLQRQFFYRLLRFLSPVEIPVDAGDYRLLDRQVIENLRGFSESALYLRGIISFVGYSQIGIDYHRRERFSGVSKFNWFSYLDFALDGITSFSRKPLSLIAWLGFFMSALSFAGTLFYLLYHFLHRTNAPGFTTLVLVILTVGGIQLLCLGLIGIYTGRIYEEVKRRPRAIVETIVTSEKTSS